MGFEAFSALVLEISVFSDITLCSPLKINRRFKATFRLNFYGRGLNQAKKPALNLAESTGEKIEVT
jgi:hypothetical protein